MVGVAVPKRESEGEQVTVRADDNAHIVLDFGNSRYASIATGFTMQKYRSCGGGTVRQSPARCS